MSNFKWKDYTLSTKDSIKPLSILTSILYLTKDYNDNQIRNKSPKLMREMYKALQKETYPELRSNEELSVRWGIGIKDNLLEATFYLEEFDKTYYVFSNKFRANFKAGSKILGIEQAILGYISFRKNYMTLKNKLNNYMENPQEYCQEALNTASEKENLMKDNFIYNLLEENININFPEDVVSNLLNYNLIIINQDGTSRIVEKAKSKKYLLLLKLAENNYQPLYMPDTTIFTDKSEIVMSLKADNMPGLENITADLEEPEEDLAEYIDNLNLVEA